MALGDAFSLICAAFCGFDQQLLFSFLILYDMPFSLWIGLADGGACLSIFSRLKT